MAITVEGARLTAAHRRGQLAVRARTLRDLLVLWPLFRPSDFATFEAFAAAAALLVTARHRESAGLGAAYFSAFRRVEIGSPAEPRVVGPPPTGIIVDKLRATGLLGVLNARRAGLGVEAARSNGLVRVSGAAAKMVLDGGRQSIVASLDRDGRALGWQRVTGPSPCAFCAMIASRGTVFKGERDAEFQAHDHDSCTAEPVYPGSRPLPRNMEFRRQWDESTAGLSGVDAANAFRRARTVAPDV